MEGRQRRLEEEESGAREGEVLNSPRGMTWHVLIGGEKILISPDHYPLGGSLSLSLADHFPTAR